MPINIETRGSGGDFQQVGILSKQTIDEDGKTPGNNTDTNILPLSEETIIEALQSGFIIPKQINITQLKFQLL